VLHLNVVPRPGAHDIKMECWLSDLPPVLTISLPSIVHGGLQPTIDVDSGCAGSEMSVVTSALAWPAAINFSWTRLQPKRSAAGRRRLNNRCARPESKFLWVEAAPAAGGRETRAGRWPPDQKSLGRAGACPLRMKIHAQKTLAQVLTVKRLATYPHLYPRESPVNRFARLSEAL